jgi:uncharacterized membrane-anchored protein
MNKLPRITVWFWIMKICATTLGETAGDLMSMTLHVGYALSSLILIGVFLLTFGAQLLAKTYHPFLYWTVILSTSTAGTTMSDYMDRTLGLGYTKGAAILLAILSAVLALWKWSVGTLSVNDIRTRKAELFYWTAILFSNTLGTAMGDFLADDSGLGFAGGAALITALLMIVLALYRFTRISRVALFWAAFVLTRPFGATMGDVLTKPKNKGGLDLGTAGASLVLAAVLTGVILYTMRRDRQRDGTAALT